jgi:hypothetical protein
MAALQAGPAAAGASLICLPTRATRGKIIIKEANDQRCSTTRGLLSINCFLKIAEQLIIMRAKTLRPELHDEKFNEIYLPLKNYICTLTLFRPMILFL